MLRLEKVARHYLIQMMVRRGRESLKLDIVIERVDGVEALALMFILDGRHKQRLYRGEIGDFVILEAHLKVMLV
jgi:hypothetical protein